MPAHKLQGRTDFQGLPISIENKTGSKRHWYDVGEQKAGVTVMKFPYGYVRGTLGTDGDEVDVYIGKNKASEKVFVITQNKAPEFVKIDEQKVMLGFNSSEQAKLAYLAHMNKPKAFRAMKELTMDEFKAKLTSHKGKLIKGLLITDTRSAKMGDTAETRVDKEMSMTTASEDLQEIQKALTARFASSITKRARMAGAIQQYEAARVFAATPADGVPQTVAVAEAQPLMGTSRERPLAEPPVVPVRAIHNDLSHTTTAPEMFKSCTGCGRMTKSLTECITCDNRVDPSATPIWKR